MSTAPTPKKKPGKAAAQALQIVPVDEQPLELTAARKAELGRDISAAVTRFRALHDCLRISVAQFKLISHLCGMEASLLHDLHHELYGETRGGQYAKDAPKIGPWMEEQLGVTERVWRKHWNTWRAAATARPELAKKILKAWEAWKSAKLKIKAPAKPKALNGSKAKPAKTLIAASSTTDFFSKGGFTADDLQELLNASDDWGLHELFEVPLKDVSEPPPDPPGPKEETFAFWISDFQKRFLKDEYLKLPKAHREALLTTAEEMAAKLKESLKK